MKLVDRPAVQHESNVAVLLGHEEAPDEAFCALPPRNEVVGDQLVNEGSLLRLVAT